MDGEARLSAWLVSSQPMLPGLKDKGQRIALVQYKLLLLVTVGFTYDCKTKFLVWWFLEFFGWCD
jgi:hypothetical protein